MSQFYTSTDHFVLLPALMLALFGCAVLLFDFWVFPEPRQRKWLLLFVALAEVFTGIALWRQSAFLAAQGGGSLQAFQGSLTIDGFAIFFNWLFLAITLLVGLISYQYLETENEHRGEYYGLLLLAQCGMYFLAAGTDLVTIFVGLELMAVSFYVMVGFLRESRRSNEAAMKYLLLGGFSSGFLAYGFSVLYGIAGSTKLSVIGDALRGRSTTDPLVLLALTTTAVGLFFKVSAVPFHMWAPDTYEGAPTTVTAFLAVGSKAASFALLTRFFLGPLDSLRDVWQPVLIVVAVLSLTVGNLAAVTQTNLKRLLAYSSISHAGYIMLGIIAGGENGVKAVMVYMLAYAFMTLGAFLVIVAMRRKNLLGEELDDVRGLMHKSPGYAIAMLIFLLALAGIPPTSGYIAKYYVFLALIGTQHYVLAAVAAAYVAVSTYYYFRIVKSMFVSEPGDDVAPSTSFGLQAALLVSSAITLAIGIYPEPLVKFVQGSLSVFH
jgi:NADH-quinone oxidoreductase subunit N